MTLSMIAPELGQSGRTSSPMPSAGAPVVADVGLALFVVALGEGDRHEPMSLVEAAGARVRAERPQVEAIGLHGLGMVEELGADALAGAGWLEVQVVDPAG